MKFNFKVKAPGGEYREGTVEASSKEVAVAILQKSDLLPIDVRSEEENEDDFFRFILRKYDKVTAKELVIFFRQLAILIEARVPIVVALNAISEQSSGKYLQKIIKEVARDIENGLPFSFALEKHRDVFTPLMINIIKAGEASGNLKKSVDYVANNIEKNYKLTSRVRGAMIYPAIILLVFFIVGFLTITLILPKLTVMIKDLGADVPWYTNVIIAIGDFMQVYWWVVLIVVAGMFVGTIYYLNSEDGKKEFDVIKMKLPVFGSIFEGVYVSRFAENLGVLLTGGIPIVKALEIVSLVVGNSVYEKIIMRASQEVKIGGDVSTIFSKSELIPPVVAHMIRIGEESGQLDVVLGHIARFYDQETETATKNLSSLIEPFLMVLIGIAVAFLAFAILMPIYNIAGQIE